MLRYHLGTTTEGKYLILESIYVEPTKSATIKYKFVNGTSVTDHEYVMDGEQYARWGTDDTIIYHLLCAKHRLQYKPYQEPEFFEETMVWRDEASGEMKCELIKKPNPNYTGQALQIENVPLPEGVARLQEDARSVHNEQDIARIQTLQQQLDEQAAKLKTITELLFKNGSL